MTSKPVTAHTTAVLGLACTVSEILLSPELTTSQLSQGEPCRLAPPRRLRARLLGGVVVGACALAGVAATSGTSEAANGPTMDIQILSFNDFHGNLEPPAGSSGRLVVDHYLDTTVTPNRSTSPPTASGGQASGQRRWRGVPRHAPQAGATGPPRTR